MKSDSQEYFVVFDTNALYHSYDRRADFRLFSFNGTYDNIIGYINQLDIYEKVVIVIPCVVWKEMERQIIEAHQAKIKEFREKVSKYHFPEIEIVDRGDVDYSDFICQTINAYRANLSSDINKVIELPIASEARYRSIVKRAFYKQPPFEGKDKKSDKGFKDALLWESILEFTAQHTSANIIYYSQDNIFGQHLEKEFSVCFPNATLTICSTENDVKQCSEKWAKEIDIYSYTPIESYVEHQKIIDWLHSGDFLIQVIDRDFGLVEKSRLITSSTVKLIDFDNIQINNQTEDETEYSIDVNLELSYTLKDGLTTKENIDVYMIVTCGLDNIYAVKDVCMPGEESTNENIIE